MSKTGLSLKEIPTARWKVKLFYHLRFQIAKAQNKECPQHNV